MESKDLSEEDKQVIYNWIDEIPLSRPKKSITRDFSDGVLIAEVVKHFIPKIVDIHNYSSFNSVTQKRYNWDTLNKKVLKKLGHQLTKVEIENLVNCIPDAVERLLKIIKPKIECYKSKPEDISPSSKKPSIPVSSLIKAGTSMQQQANSTEMIAEKEQTIQELKETIEIMEVKIKKLEQLIRLKDSKIQALSNMLAQNGISDTPNQ